MEDIMELRAKFLHRQVKVVDGSNEDGEFGFVVGVTAHSAEPITVLFYTIGPVRHCNYYTADDLEVVPGVFEEGRQRDSVVRCHRSRFDTLYYVFDCNGVHGVGYGTPGAAWAAFLAEVGRKEETNGEEVAVDAADKMADAASQINHVVGAADGCQLRDGLGLGQGPEQSDVAECDETQGPHGVEVGGLDEEVGEGRAD